MADKPIIFSAPMIRALLESRKTQTRRVIKLPTKDIYEHPKMGGWAASTVGGKGVYLDPAMTIPAPEQACIWHQTTGTTILPPYAVSDRLWVRETWRPTASFQPWDLDVTYAADAATRVVKDGEFGEKDWTMPKAAATGNVSPLFMPRWASRITLTVTDVRVQQIRDMSDQDAIAEGIEHIETMDEIGWKNYAPNWPNLTFERPLPSFATRWNSIHGPEQFAENPWVAAYTFSVHRGNIDQLEAAA